jgi:hypothetical protein
LCEKRVVPRLHRVLTVDPCPKIPSWDDVEYSEPAYDIRVIKRQPVCDAPAPVMPSYGKPLETERAHRRNLIERHRSFRIRLVIAAAIRFIASTVASKVRKHEREVVHQKRCYFSPGYPRLRITMKQQERRPGTADEGINFDAGAWQTSPLESLNEPITHNAITLLFLSTSKQSMRK